MGRINYALGRVVGRLIFFAAIRKTVVRLEETEREGGFILAVTHLSHLEPCCVSIIVRRKIDWMARKEFYGHPLAAWGLRAVDAFCVNRQGVPVSAIRTAVARVRAGKLVGIFPEGGVAIGSQSACRGGKIKRGVCMVSMRSGAPVVPVVVVNTHTLNCVRPWLPFRRGNIWMIFGKPIPPPEPVPAPRSGRAGRAEMAEKLESAFTSLYQELCRNHGVDDSRVP